MEDTNDTSCWNSNGKKYYAQTLNAGYSVAGAVNGVCCGGYTSYSECTLVNDELTDENCSMIRVDSYNINKNGQVAYCADNQRTWLYTSTSKETNGPVVVYVSPSKVCKYPEGEIAEGQCTCSSSGDPANGSSCS